MSQTIHLANTFYSGDNKRKQQYFSQARLTTANRSINSKYDHQEVTFDNLEFYAGIQYHKPNGQNEAEYSLNKWYDKSILFMTTIRNPNSDVMRYLLNMSFMNASITAKLQMNKDTITNKHSINNKNTNNIVITQRNRNGRATIHHACEMGNIIVCKMIMFLT